MEQSLTYYELRSTQFLWQHVVVGLPSTPSSILTNTTCKFVKRDSSAVSNLQVGKLSPHLYNSQVKAVTEGEANEQGIYFNIFHYSFLFLGFPVWCMVHCDLTKMLANDKWKVRVLRSLWIYYFALTNLSAFSLFLQRLTQDHRCIIFQKFRSQINHAFPSSTFDRNIVTGILLLLDLSVHQKQIIALEQQLSGPCSWWAGPCSWWMWCLGMDFRTFSARHQVAVAKVVNENHKTCFFVHQYDLEVSGKGEYMYI